MKVNDSVRASVGLMLAGMLLLLAVVASAGTLGVGSTNSHVEALVHGLEPAAYRNDVVHHDMTRAQASLRGWALTGDQSFRANYHRARRGAQIELAALATIVRDDPELVGAVAAQRDATREWFSSAERMLGTRSGAVPAGYLRDEQRSFDRFIERNDVVSHRVDEAIQQRGEAALSEARWVVWWSVGVSLLGLVVAVLGGRRFIRRVSQPLGEMESALERLASGDLSVRVRAQGPREVRSVAAAVNALAEENQRARELEEQVVARLTALDRAKDEFVSTVSHELRTPLTSIRGYIELLDDDFADDMDAQQRQMVAVLKRNVQRLRGLIEDLLTLSRVESGAFHTTLDTVDVRQVATDSVRDVEEIAARAGVVVVPVLPEEPVEVWGDAGQLGRAVLNLVTNAVKFSPATGEVRVEVTSAGSDAVVSVADRGIGIPPEELATVGTRFFRASNAVEAEIGGTGLGLRIVQTIADNHGGRLRIDSEMGQGTTARLAVPLQRSEAHRNIPAPEEIHRG